MTPLVSALDLLRGGLVVSCQPLPDEPDDPFRGGGLQTVMAAAAVLGGAVGIRANGPADIAAIGAAVDVPVIGLWKRGEWRGGATVAITPTAADAVAVATAGAAIVAVDATARPRPDGMTFADTVAAVHAGTGALVLADVSDVAEAVAAVDAGADAVAGTLSIFCGGAQAGGPDFDIVAALVDRVGVPVIAEGRYATAEDVERAFALGAHAVVAGNAITSPLALTRRLVAGTPHTVTTRKM